MEAAPSEEMVAKLRPTDEAFAAGEPVAEAGRSLRVSAVTSQRWRAEYRATDWNDVRQLRDWER